MEFDFSVYLHDPSSRSDFGNLHELERLQYLCKKLNKYVCKHDPCVMHKKNFDSRSFSIR